MFAIFFFSPKLEDKCFMDSIWQMDYPLPNSSNYAYLPIGSVKRIELGTTCCAWSYRPIVLLHVQWSLQFKTPPFNNSLHFKTGHPATQLLYFQSKYPSILRPPSL